MCILWFLWRENGEKSDGECLMKINLKRDLIGIVVVIYVFCEEKMVKSVMKNGRVSDEAGL